MLADPKTERKAFGILVNQYGEKLYWQIRRIVLTHDDANDVLQNVFLKAWNNLDSFRNESKLSTWLYRIAVNQSLDFMRSNSRRTGISLEECDNGIANTLAADRYFDGDKTEALLIQAISRLPEVQRTVFNMRYYDNMKYSEISKILNTSEGALKASYHIAVKKISEYFNSID
ncbi:RNA polymerase sigma factor [Prevotella sp. PMUR]|uniref:RNA polymerase sigma factor n=2 Tax=Xylanibacter muris TaxID=2736290 RepID=A0ABX2AT50_9BACT|nr:RNA polymerase sigma factor [Xylanibacter muris]NPD93131.1 RNA polymerase sigma factor [Xylanibacter muris]